MKNGGDGVLKKRHGNNCDSNTSAPCAIFYQQMLTKRRKRLIRGFFMVSDIG